MTGPAVSVTVGVMYRLKCRYSRRYPANGMKESGTSGRQILHYSADETEHTSCAGILQAGTCSCDIEESRRAYNVDPLHPILARQGQ